MGEVMNHGICSRGTLTCTQPTSGITNAAASNRIQIILDMKAPPLTVTKLIRCEGIWEAAPIHTTGTKLDPGADHHHDGLPFGVVGQTPCGRRRPPVDHRLRDRDGRSHPCGGLRRRSNRTLGSVGHWRFCATSPHQTAGMDAAPDVGIGVRYACVGWGR
jgi:hypothetical protein